MPVPVRRAARYLLRGVLFFLVLVVLLVAGVAVAGGRALGRVHEVPTHVVTLPTDPAALAEGGRLAGFWGCTGCHEKDAAGGYVFIETRLGDRLAAPNLTRIVREYTVPELERAIRHGVHPDGSSLVIMPASAFNRMSDTDLGKVIAYLRSLPPVPDTVPPNRYGLMARTFVLLEDSIMEADKIDESAPHPASPDSLTPESTRADTLALGRYLARTGCTECHGLDLHGSPGGETPDLRIAAAYSREQFLRLAREGIALDGKEREMMTDIALSRLARLTDDELSAVHTYLETLAD